MSKVLPDMALSELKEILAQIEREEARTTMIQDTILETLKSIQTCRSKSERIKVVTDAELNAAFSFGFGEFLKELVKLDNYDPNLIRALEETVTLWVCLRMQNTRKKKERIPELLEHIL